MGERLITSLELKFACGVGMCAGLNGPPVLPQSNCHGIDSIHDALVVRGGPALVQLRESVTLQQPLRYLTPAQSAVP